MKAKHWIAVGVIAVVCVGAVVLFSNKAPTEGVPVSSSVPAASEEPTATEEPAVSEEPAQTGESTVKPEDIKAEETAPTVTEPEVEPTKDEDFEYKVQHKMDKWGMSREEAEKSVRDSDASAKKSFEEANAKREEYFNQREAERKANREARHKEFERQAGISVEQYNAMDIDSRIQFRRDHPDVDWSLL